MKVQKLVTMPHELSQRIDILKGFGSANATICRVLDAAIPPLEELQANNPVQAAMAAMKLEQRAAKAQLVVGGAPPAPAAPEIPPRPFVGKFGSQAQFLARDGWDIQYGDEEAKAAALAGLEARKAAVEAEKAKLEAERAKARAKGILPAVAAPSKEEAAARAAQAQLVVKLVEKEDEEWA